MVPPALLKLRLQDEAGEVLKYKAYSIGWRDSKRDVTPGFTDVDGVLTEEIPLGASIADITVGDVIGQATVKPGWQLVVRLTTLGRADSLAGAAPRLSNLGYLVPPAPAPTEDANLAPWADGHQSDIEEAALTYHYHAEIQNPVSYQEVYTKVAKDHDKG